jgi:hypothetical protein
MMKPLYGSPVGLPLQLPWELPELGTRGSLRALFEFLTAMPESEFIHSLRSWESPSQRADWASAGSDSLSIEPRRAKYLRGIDQAQVQVFRSVAVAGSTAPGPVR